MSDSEKFDEAEDLDVAIVGISCRFPGAKDADEYWRNLAQGVESISFYSEAELVDAGVHPDVARLPDYVKAEPFLEDIDKYDAEFFSYSPREAELMDPQQRVFMECAWHALENAGYVPDNYAGSIGVFAGVRLNRYVFNLISHLATATPLELFEAIFGNDNTYLATRTSHKLDLRGPSFTVECACATSLVAVHLACQSLLTYQTDMALAGAVSLRGDRPEGYFYQEGMMNSPDGHCRAYDAKAGGTVFGGGVGVVVLKRLADATRDEDQIYAVIKGSAVNNDGSAKVGFTAPSERGQAQVIEQALAMAQVDPDTITYVEGHGTATILGDPIEVAALTRAFRRQTDRTGYCALGSAKTNVGHLDIASGMAGLIKTVLQLRNRKLVPSLHFEEPNPAIDFDSSPFFVNTQLKDWETNGTPRRAGVSCYGMGGTNAHIIVEEAPQSSTKTSIPRPWQVILTTGRTVEARAAASQDLQTFLSQEADVSLADVAYTSQIGRKHFSHRRAVVCCAAKDAVSALQSADARFVVDGEAAPRSPQIAFGFPGQGAQYASMGRGLYDNEPVFRTSVDQCADFLRDPLGLDLRSILFAEGESGARENAKLMQTQFTQPAIFVIEYALAQLWRSWGIEPEFMIGHSIGEYAAACIAGVFSLEDALRVVAARGALMQRMRSGSMLAISLPERDVVAHLDADVSLAAVNAPALCVVSGPTAAVTVLHDRLTEQGVQSRMLHTSHAFHSEMMEPALEPFAQEVERIRLHKPRLPIISNVTGTWLRDEEAMDPRYWARQLRDPVRFSDGLTTLFDGRDVAFVEVGPGQTLSTMARSHPGGRQSTVIASLRHPRQQEDDHAFLLKSLARVWSRGVEVNWSALHVDENPKRVGIPTYPFQRQRYWIEAGVALGTPGVSPAMLLKKSDPADWFYVPSWKRSALSEANSSEPASWLVFADQTGLTQAVVDRLSAFGEVIVVRPNASGFEVRKEGEEFAIRPGHAEDLRRLLDALAANEGVPRRIVHLWSSGEGHDDLDGALGNGFFQLTALTQTLSENDRESPFQIDVVTVNAQQVLGSDLLHPLGATTVAPCRVIGQEYGNIQCRAIDVDLRHDEPDAVAALLTKELTRPAAGVVAYRANQRWVEAFEAVRIEEPIEASVGLRQGGTYWITGGLGGVGLAIARHLAIEAQANLVLTSRTALPEREMWAAWSETHGVDDPVSQKVARIAELESLGARVSVMSGDIADAAAVQAMVQRITEDVGSLSGVIHAAGVPGGGLIALKSESDMMSVLRPKVHGTCNLYAALRDRDLDFFVVMSSLRSVLGELGQVDYCAANAFLDAYALCSRQGSGTPIMSINWDAWQEAGMAKGMVMALGPSGLTNDEGVDAFMRCLGQRRSIGQVLVSTRDLDATIEGMRKITTSAVVGSLGNSKSTHAQHPRPHLATPYVEPSSELEASLAQIWQGVLGLESIGIQDNFIDLGGHSLLATQLVTEVRAEHHVEISLKEFLANPTISVMAGIIGQQQTRSEPEPIREAPPPA